LFDWDGVTPTGAFEVVSDYPWDTTNLYTTGEVTLIPEPATAMLVACVVLLAAGVVAVKRWRAKITMARSRDRPKS
jgi:hypothetical protein